MNFQQRKSTTVIVAIAVIVGLGMVGSGQTMTAAYGFQAPYIAAPTPFNPPTTVAPPPSYFTTGLNGNPHMCMMTTLPSDSPTRGPGDTFIYDMASYPNNPPSTVLQASSFTGWCAQQNTTDGDNVGIVNMNYPNLMGLDVNHPCWVQNGIGYYGDCDVAPVRGYSQGNYTDGASSPSAALTALPGNGGIPTEEWFHLAGVDLKPGTFLDLADTTPWYTTHGHMAMVLPCETDGTPDLRLYQGIIDGGVFTMEAPTMQYLNHISSPTTLGMCVYHFDIGLKTDADAPYMGDANGHPAQTKLSANPYGVTDFALVNTSGHDVDLVKTMKDTHQHSLLPLDS